MAWVVQMDSEVLRKASVAIALACIALSIWAPYFKSCLLLSGSWDVLWASCAFRDVGGHGLIIGLVGTFLAEALELIGVVGLHRNNYCGPFFSSCSLEWFELRT